MKFFSFITVFVIVLAFSMNAQVITVDPEFPTDADAVVVTFDATEGDGGLEGFTGDVYAHTGVITNQSASGSDWRYAPDWGDNDDKYKLTRIDTDLYELEIDPSIRDYYGVPVGETIEQLAFVFRGGEPGDPTGRDVGGADIFYDVIDAGLALNFNSPQNNSLYDLNDTVEWDISTSQQADITMYINGVEESAANDVTSLTGDYVLSSVGGYWFKVVVEADTTIMDSAYVVAKAATETEALPSDVTKGINYHEGDTSVTLVLETPVANKEYAFVVGDFTNWFIDNNYQMKQTPDGKYFWLYIGNLTPQEEYVFQYWVDDDVKIGDPYAEKVADPWNDGYIPESVYPDLPEYTKTAYQTATVLQTGQPEYAWAASEDTWERPDLDNLVIYELLVRDFVETHSYSTLMDTLSYLKRLGIEAIEIMPFNEFEGNSSWGYNPSYYFAPDKYYGPKDSLKKFIETAHQEGLAVIMDMVLNHAYGQNALAKLYWDGSKPAADNPWFNRDLPANHYGWGNDFDHTSDHTKAFIDSVNTYWIEEYHVDGYRFDYTKGFTNSTSPNGYVADRIAILKRMADVIWAQDPEAYVILEHWGPPNEEGELADYGMKLWLNESYEWVPSINGTNGGSFGDMKLGSHVTYYNSHDEQRIAWHALNEGVSSADGSYNVKDTMVMFERKKMMAAFAYLFPGPKMIWQFDELGYDINIDFNGRTGEKPLPWGDDGLGYYEDPLRQHIYTVYSAILSLRKEIGADNLASANSNNEYLSGQMRRLVYDMGSEGLVVIGNFGVEDGSINPKFTQTGKWYNYFSGDSIQVPDPEATIDLKAGEWHVFTTTKYADGFPGAVEVYSNPVAVSPYPFRKNDEITITFDASEAFTDGTDGLVGASEVYMYSGIITDPANTELSHIVNDANAQMTNVSGDVWEITLTPDDYYGLQGSEDIFQIGLFFRDADSTNFGLGFRNTMIYLNVQSSEPLVSITPEAFTIDDEVTITFNANAGDQALINSDEVYIHTGVVLSDVDNPGGDDWQNVPGDWADNSWGGMTASDENPGFWNITFTPRDFYTNDTDPDLADGDTIFWIAAVFRNASGAIKGSDDPGVYDWGIIQSNKDIFIKNNTANLSISNDAAISKYDELLIYPNPSSSNIMLGNDDIVEVSIVSISGKVVLNQSFDGHSKPGLNVNNLESGMYFIQAVDKDNNQLNGKFLKIE